MNGGRKDQSDITFLDPEFNFQSEIGAAWNASRDGDFWPIALLEAKAGKKERLANLIRIEGVTAGGEAAKAIADMLDGTFKPTKRDKSRMREYEVLSIVSLFNTIRLAVAGDASATEKKSRLQSLEDVYITTAEKLGMTKDAVEKIVTRNRKRIKGLS